MENQHETISIHVGQCGVQLGDNLWELYCNEQSIDPNGKLIYEKYFFNDPFFSETKSGKYIPRALFVDLDAESIDNIRTGRRKNLYNSDQFISYNEDASKNYACGYYTTGPHLIERTLEGIRKLANQCSNLQGFMIFHSLGGGTGSGFSSLLFDRLNSEYPKASKFNFAIFPSEIGCSSNYEIYNTALSVHSIDDQMKCCFSFDNKSLYDISKRLLDVSNPSFRTMNEIVCQVAASVTNPLRQNRSNVENATLNIFRSYANLRPFYTPNFLVCSYAPLYPAPRSCAQFTVDDLTKDAFEPENVLIECNIRKRKYYACGFFYRGGICPKDITEAVQNILRRGIFQFVNSPDCFQFGLNYQYGSTIDNSEMIKYTSSLCLVSNTTAIADKWSKIDQEFNSLYKKRQYIHSYICEGMEQLEFKEAQDELNNLLNEYEDFDASDTEIKEEEEF